ncbi:hypothetical protein GC093_25360 [Paenibacillus sp. LMG 31456]|uniref:Uncharacterized protein n=1 Tax=Paenibacillus foliorum TaxID=2654974 RepID=A0A972GTE1_9BACL|nr:hypothetical protein [Paenibacillus foliorum]NOU96521.1 hypothetical protein [Paenibacillus foliorum]
MNWHEEENRTKLHILNSLARSQRALARIIESMADMTESSASSGTAADKLVEQLEAISRYQRQLTEKISGIRIRKFRRGTPGKPWLSRRLRRPT